MSRLSVVIITRNEEANLSRCLEAIKFADEIVVVDSGSVDKTIEIARQFGAAVHEIEWHGFSAAKREGVARAGGDWILSVDADEVVPPQLADEIRAVIEKPEGRVGYYLPRRTRFLGRWIYHCGWYPDPVLRLFRKAEGNFDESRVHEKVVVKGPTGTLEHDLLHFSYPTLQVYFEKLDRYTTLAAEEAGQNGRGAGAYDIIVRPFACFVKHYFIRRGFLDGLEGLMISVLSACYVMTKYAKIRELTRCRRYGNGDLS